MAKKGIPEEVKRQANEIVMQFNKNGIADLNVSYLTRYGGRFLYLDRVSYGHSGPICRLEYTGDINQWEFAIFKYSDGKYDPEEWLFPGSEHVDGTIEGAMKAGIEAYPD
jgi:hypothetical protein